MVTHILEIGTHSRTGALAAFCRDCDEWTSVEVSGPFHGKALAPMLRAISHGLLAGFRPRRCSIAERDEVRHVLPNLVRPAVHVAA